LEDREYFEKEFWGDGRKKKLVNEVKVQFKLNGIRAGRVAQLLLDKFQGMNAFSTGQCSEQGINLESELPKD
jgi:hypothetical protein